MSYFLYLPTGIYNAKYYGGGGKKMDAGQKKFKFDLERKIKRGKEKLMKIT